MMSFQTNDYPNSMMGLDYLVRAKALDISNTMEEEGHDRDSILTQAPKQAQDWFDNASEEEKEELRKRYPEEKINREFDNH